MPSRIVYTFVDDPQIVKKKYKTHINQEDSTNHLTEPKIESNMELQFKKGL